MWICPSLRSAAWWSGVRLPLAGASEGPGDGRADITSAHAPLAELGHMVEPRARHAGLAVCPARGEDVLGGQLVCPAHLCRVRPWTGGLPCPTAKASHPRCCRSAQPGLRWPGGRCQARCWPLGCRVSKPAGAPPSQTQSDRAPDVNQPTTQTSVYHQLPR